MELIGCPSFRFFKNNKIGVNEKYLDHFRVVELHLALHFGIFKTGLVRHQSKFTIGNIFCVRRWVPHLLLILAVFQSWKSHGPDTSHMVPSCPPFLLQY